MVAHNMAWRLCEYWTQNSAKAWNGFVLLWTAGIHVSMPFSRWQLWTRLNLGRLFLACLVHTLLGWSGNEKPRRLCFVILALTMLGLRKCFWGFLSFNDLDLLNKRWPRFSFLHTQNHVLADGTHISSPMRLSILWTNKWLPVPHFKPSKTGMRQNRRHK